MRNAANRRASPHDSACRPGSAQPFEFVDVAGDYRHTPGPEGGVGGVEAERREQLAMPHRAARAQHSEIALRETLVRVLVDRVERVHQTIAESIGIDIERRVDEMRDVGPIMAVETVDAQCRTEAFALHVEPDLAELVRGQLGLAPLLVNL